MSTEITTRGPASDLTIKDGQAFFTEKQVAALHQLGVSNASNADLAVFFHTATRTGLDPFARQIYMIERQGKQTIQTGIDGFRLVARRATDRAKGTFGYEDTLWCGEDGQWKDVWLSNKAPVAAKVTVLRDGQRYPAIALYQEYVALKRDGKPNSMWASKPALMLAKCAEALALRRAFPQDLSDVYSPEEMSAAVPVDEPAEPSPRSGSAKLAAAVAGRRAPRPAGPAEEVHDAEVVEDAVERVTPDPQDPAAGDEFATPAPKPATNAQRSALLEALAARQIAATKPQVLAFLTAQLGREVSATDELTADEVEGLLIEIGQMEGAA
ncbi:phage recombination protein Bet [Xylanimonas oleitrophica]|uniref:Phage recombination protein Bet n=1 Tax=Xylanimonas oleitrophica TaxID=2607479 RepID=A0A2W5XX56_9MICO|nr:phage recombination protein Bet [Xylanimonas oleitrophica]PZR55288.1 phage recombination protein Bet [Xylanimonas oleitrophica]